MDKNILKQKLIPFALALAVILLDQITKILVVHYIEPGTIGFELWDGFFRLIHVSNTGVAFSMGADFPTVWRAIMFRLVPLVVIALVCVVYFRNNTFTKLQNWAITGIVGGGLGNLIDRFFRPEGVVDFLDVKFFTIPKVSPYGRWPTFNVADSAVVICGILLLISFIITSFEDEKKIKEKNKEAKQ